MRSMFMVLCISPLAWGQTVATFENLTLAPNSFVNNTTFSSGGVVLNNAYDSNFGSWSGFSYSNVKNTTTGDFTNQYAAYVTPLPANPLGAGAGGSANYAVAYDSSAYGFDAPPTMTFANGQHPTSLMITNTTYAAISMRDGDGFAKKFGGTTGDDPDFLLLTIKGFDINGMPTGTVPFYLADYRFSNNAQDYIVQNWTSADLSSLAASTQILQFTLTSTDPDGFGGYNTPLYFAVDSIVVVPEPVSLLLPLMGLFWIRKRK